MYKKKRENNVATAAPPEPDSEKLVLVKAAAWAWHQHSSSSISKQGPEFPSARPRQRSSHGPSRYRLESLSKSDTTASPVSSVSEKTGPITLLDLYEIERITRELERLMAASEKREKFQGKKMQKKKNKEGLGCLLGMHAVKICGSNYTISEREPLVGRHRQNSNDILHRHVFVRK